MGAPGLALEAGDASLLKALARIRLVAFDFDGVFTDNSVYVFDDGREAVRCSRMDSMGLSHLKALGIESVIVSTEKNPVVSHRAKKLGLPCVQGCADKVESLGALIASQGMSWDEVAFVGNDINDAACLEAVGVPIVVADAHRDVLGHAAYVTAAKGGSGAVREVCDLIAAARGLR